MRKWVQAAGIVIVLGSVWYGLWSWLMADDVVRVKTSIAYQYKHLREFNQKTSLESDAVYATGFPFRYAVAIKRLTLSMVDGEETYAISVPLMTLEATDSAQGTYRVRLSDSVEALYARNGQAPEHYVATPNVMPDIWLSAADATKACGMFVGVKCADVAADAPLISYAVKMPKAITLHMQLGDQAKDAVFEQPLLSAPVSLPIPADANGPLQLLVGVLREALVFQTK